MRPRYEGLLSPFVTLPVEGGGAGAELEEGTAGESIVEEVGGMGIWQGEAEPEEREAEGSDGAPYVPALERSYAEEEEPLGFEAPYATAEEEEAAPSVDLRARIVAVAKHEWQRWGRGTRKEAEPGMAGALREYWGPFLQRMKSEEAERALRGQAAWSAAFVSYVMRQAGAGSAFPYAVAHRQYIAAAKRDRQQHSPSNFWAYEITEVKPELGDVVCRDREPRPGAGCSGTTYANVDERTPDGRQRLWATHGDIVVGVESGAIEVIGGNVRDSVGLSSVKLNAQGFIIPKQGMCSYFAVLKAPSPTSMSQKAAGDSSLGSFPVLLSTAVRQGVITLQVAQAIVSGQRDVNALTNMAFYAKHPELPMGYRIQPHEKAFALDWLRMRDQVIKPLLRGAIPSGGSVVSPPSPKSKSTPPGTIAEFAVPSPRGYNLRGGKRVQPVYGVIVHTTGSGPASIAHGKPEERARLECQTPVECALAIYATGDGFPHYLIDYDGAVYATCPEDFVAWHAGWTKKIGGRDRWKRWSPPTWWSKVWGDNKTPLDLLPPAAPSPNTRHIGVELLGAVRDEAYTHEQYRSLARLVEDLDRRYSLGIVRAPSPKLLGHEDVNPLPTEEGGRANARGGWDPGAHRANEKVTPRFSWSMLWSLIQRQRESGELEYEGDDGPADAETELIVDSTPVFGDA